VVIGLKRTFLLERGKERKEEAQEIERKATRGRKGRDMGSAI
jgi:hypothetical protein